jgi:hypothetical protein
MTENCCLSTARKSPVTKLAPSATGEWKVIPDGAYQDHGHPFHQAWLGPGKQPIIFAIGFEAVQIRWQFGFLKMMLHFNVFLRAQWSAG